MASWLDSFFSFLDRFILSVCHLVAQSSFGNVLTPFFKGVSFFGYGGLGFLVIALVLVLIPKTRRAGVVMAVAIGLAVLSAELIKLGVGRLRPYQAAANFHDWWLFVGGEELRSSSFPSCHVAATTAACLAAFLELPKPSIVNVGFIAVLLMCFSRNYLLVHYPSDCLGGILVGVLVAIIVHRLANTAIRMYNRRMEAKGAQDA